MNKTIVEEMNKNEVLQEVLQVVADQTAKGFEKYGRLVQSDALTTIEWLQHYREEMIDGAVYATCVIKKLEELENK